MLKNQAKEAAESVSKFESDRVAQEKNIQERSARVEAEERRLKGAMEVLDEKEKAILSREADVKELEEGWEAKGEEVERGKERMAGAEKALETKEAELDRRRVSSGATAWKYLFTELE